MSIRLPLISILSALITGCAAADQTSGGPATMLGKMISPSVRTIATPAGPMFTAVSAGAPAAAAGAKAWGIFAQLAGTKWNDDNRAVFSYRWIEDGRELEIAEQGWFGTRVTRIVYDPAARSLIATTTDLDSGEKWQDPVQLRRDAYVQCSARSASDPVQRCIAYSVEQNVLFARLSVSAKAPPTRVWYRKQIDEAAATRLVAGFSHFPARAPGSYDVRSGVLGLMAGGDWRAVLTDYGTSQSACCGQRAVIAKLDGNRFAVAAMEAEVGGYGDKAAVTAFLFDHVDDGALTATRLASTSATPEGSAPVHLRVLRGGVARVENSNEYTDWHLAASGRTALARKFAWTGTNTVLVSQTTYALNTPRQGAGGIARLDGQVFRKNEGYLAIRAKDSVVTVVRYVSSRGVANTDMINCSPVAPPVIMTCNSYENGKVVDIPFAQDATRFRLANTIYSVIPNGDLQLTTDGKVNVLPRTSLLAFAFETQGKRGQDLANENYRNQARAAANERQRQADNDALWRGVIGSLAKGAAQIASGNYGNAYSTTRTDWGSAGSVAVGQARSANGAVGDMGGVSYEAIPAGHDNLYWSQAKIDAFMDAQHANDRPLTPAPQSTGYAEYKTTPRPADTPYSAENAAAGRRVSGATANGSATSNGGVTGAGATRSGGTGSRGATSATQRTGTTPVSRASNKAGAGSDGSNALIVGPASNQAEIEALDRRNAESSARAATQAAMQKKLDDDYDAQRAADAKAALAIANGPARPKTCGAGTNQPSCPTSPR